MDHHASRYEDSSSPFRRSYLSEDDFETRNSEDVHRLALAAAQAEHDRIRDTALQAYAMNELRESQNRLQQQNAAEAERIRLETARALEETRIRELENAAKRIPKPPPRLPTPPPPPPSPPRQVQRPPSPQKPPTPSPLQQPPPVPKPALLPTQLPPPTPQPGPSALRPVAQEPTPAVKPPARPSSESHILPGAQRYVEIHKELKVMRANVDSWLQQFDKGARNTIGDLRRGLRTACGQLVVNPQKGDNNKVVCLRVLPRKHRLI
ncbi:hypothetical protein M7I_7704 [Glarea lozoyensis 74030]|uniref:Uncharacterized protein n=1 Tax=Glarea lozoyensis (strain ATCC 74030 / MF5533) TaxID=1104152 RepID=H0EY08_GLAL7|nr:hypothetical protein M7I_7704 [Glarea lozoyensis 74030]